MAKYFKFFKWAVAGLLFASQVPSAALSQSASDTIFYVASDGNDTWSGSLPTPNAERTDGPFASVARAQVAVRQARASATQPVTVLIRSGTYQLTDTIVFLPEDSGTLELPVTYANFPNENVVLSGGVPITGWRKFNENIWVADVPQVKAGQWYFHQLFVNGQRRTRARTPNAGYLFTAGFWPGITDPVLQQNDPMAKIGFRYRTGDLKSWSNVSDVNLILFHSWTTSVHFIKSLNETDRTVTFTTPSDYPIGFFDPTLRYKRYYVENYFEALDSPGEWYLDRTTGLLYYWPLPGEDLATATVTAPVLQRLVEFRGTAARQVQYITLRGLSFQHADWSLSKDETKGGGFRFDAAVLARYTRNVTMDGCEISHVGENGLWLAESQDNRVVKTHIHDLGAGGVEVSGYSASADRNVIDNSFIHDGGYVFASAYGVLMWRGNFNTLSHNEISDFYNNGINVSGLNGYGASLTHDNVIEFNHVHDIGRGVLSDLGGIYTTGESPGTTVRNNFIHDVYAYTYGGNGLYADEGSSGILFENNIVYNTGNGFNHNYGRENFVRNNIFAFGRESLVYRNQEETHLSFTFQRNIVVLENSEIFGLLNVTPSNFRFDSNLYWNVSRADLNFAGLSFDQWQARGQDQSSRIADPLFVDLQQYQLRPGSPAFSLGFQAIDSSSGLYGDPQWVRTPQNVPRSAPASTPGRHFIQDDFESSVAGELPGWGAVVGEGNGASIRVTNDLAAAGRQSLKFTGAGSTQPQRPTIYYNPYFDKGAAQLSVDVRVEAGAKLSLSWNDTGNRLGSPIGAFLGPYLSIDQNGNLNAANKTLMRVPSGQWFHLDLVCNLGAKTNGVFLLTVTIPGQDPHTFQGLPFNSPLFRRLTYMSFASLTDGPAAFYLDNVQLQQLAPSQQTTFNIANRGGASFSTSGESPATSVGYIRIQSAAGSTTPPGMAIFGFRQNNVLVSEASVPASAPIQAGRIYAEINGPVNTGVAMANPTNQAAQVSFFFTDTNGSDLGLGSTTIPANSQMAHFLNESPFNSGSSFSGTFTFNSSVPISVIALRGLTNERSDFLITTIPVSDITATSSGLLILPDFAEGGGWTTQLVLVNPTDAALNGTIQFFGQGSSTAAAQPITLTVNGQSGSTFSYSVPPRSSRQMVTSGAGDSTRVGSVRIFPAANSRTPSGMVIFSFKTAGITVAAAGVPVIASGAAFRMYAEAIGTFGQPGSIQSGVAIANPSANAATVTFELTTLWGASTGLTGTASIPANGQVALFLNQISGFSTLLPPFQGMLRISTSSASGISVVGLRARYNEVGDFLITTTPPFDESNSVSASDLVFPHFGDGGGYTTQFILFSGRSGQSSTGNLRFFSQSSQPLNLQVH